MLVNMRNSLKNPIVLLSIALTLIIFAILFQTTPRYYTRYAFISILKSYTVESPQSHVYNLTTLPRLAKKLAACGPKARPTRKKNVVVFNPRYHEKSAHDWIVIIKGRDFESWRKGNPVLWNDGSVTWHKVTHTLTENKKDLKFYYLSL